MRAPQWIPRGSDAPGLGLAALLGVASIAIVRALPPSPYISDILVALVLGALILNTPLRRAIALALPSEEREPDRWAAGFRFTGKWVLRLSIILMGFKVQTKSFAMADLALIGGVGAAALPSTFFIAHVAAARLGVRRPMADLVAGGTMICGASAVNAFAPVCGARREEQGIAIGAIFLFSVVALVVFRPLASVIGLDEAHAGLWSGLAVNDLSSAIAVGKQMGDLGGVMAAASKSARIVMLAPALVVLALMRRERAPKGAAPPKTTLWDRAVDQLPRFLLGYLAFAVVRAAGDRVADGAAWSALIGFDKIAVDVLMATVAAAIGLHLEVGKLLSAGASAIALGGVTSTWMASLTLAMIALSGRGYHSAAALVGLCAVIVTFVAWRVTGGAEKEAHRLQERFESGAPMSLSEATRLLNGLESAATTDEPTLRRLLRQLHPAIGELIPVRESPLPHGEGCRWLTYWEGKSGWALVAVCREPGSATPIHAHPHRLLGKSIEGMLEELRFTEKGEDSLELVTRKVLSHNDLVETDGLATLHLVRALGDAPAIDLQLRGPEVGSPGRRFRTLEPIDLDALKVGALVHAASEIDDRPGQGGDGAAAGRAPVAASAP